MQSSKRLSQVLEASNVLTFDESSRIVIMSDCHRGDGSWSDNFSNNQNLFFASLVHYYENGFTYIELGDGDELWENRSMSRIISTHSNVFWLMSLFYREGRLLMLYGNHDIVKKSPKFAKNNCDTYYCDSDSQFYPLFPDIKIIEGIRLRYKDTKNEIFLTHGHQADPLNDTFWRLSRFLVRYLWRPLEMIGFQNPTSPAHCSDKSNTVEKRLIDWSTKEKQMIIAGHTHRPVFPKVGEHLYFNDGSCVHPRCITALEIRNGMISLVKWSVMTKQDGTLFVGKEVLEPPIRVSDYFNSIVNVQSQEKRPSN